MRFWRVWRGLRLVDFSIIRALSRLRDECCNGIPRRRRKTTGKKKKKKRHNAYVHVE